MNSSKVGNEIKMKWIASHNTETKRFVNYMHKSAHVCVHCLLLYCTSTNDIQWHNHKESFLEFLVICFRDHYVKVDKLDQILAFIPLNATPPRSLLVSSSIPALVWTSMWLEFDTVTCQLKGPKVFSCCCFHVFKSHQGAGWTLALLFG